MSRRLAAMGILLLLTGCGNWQTPLWSWGETLWPWSADRVASAPANLAPVAIAARTPAAAIEQVPQFITTTGTDGDPRWKATMYCGKLRRYAQLRQTRLNQGEKPGGDTITWYFDCVF